MSGAAAPALIRARQPSGSRVIVHGGKFTNGKYLTAEDAEDTEDAEDAEKDMHRRERSTESINYFTAEDTEDAEKDTDMVFSAFSASSAVKYPARLISGAPR
jgi:hypothetical protein